MPSLELPAGKTSAFVISFDFDAEEVWLAENPENANRPGVLSQGTYGAKVGVGLVLDTLDHLGLPTFKGKSSAGTIRRRSYWISITFMGS